MLYNLSEVLQNIKDDIGIMDLQLPVTDEQMMNRLKQSALKEFSVRYPLMHYYVMSNEDLISEQPTPMAGKEYRIPFRETQGNTLLFVAKVDVRRPQGFSDMYIPQSYYGNPDDIISAIGNVQLIAGLAQTMARALTFRFEAPDRLFLYNGWAGGLYDVCIALAHDESLVTIPPSAQTHFIQLANLDLQQFLYNRLKRVQSLELGIGNIELKIDDWQDAGQKKMELLKEWDENANIDIDSIIFF